MCSEARPAAMSLVVSVGGFDMADGFAWLERGGGLAGGFGADEIGELLDAGGSFVDAFVGVVSELGECGEGFFVDASGGDVCGEVGGDGTEVREFGEVSAEDGLEGVIFGGERAGVNEVGPVGWERGWGHG